MRITFLVILAFLAVYLIAQILRTQHYIRIGGGLAAKAVPFSRASPNANLRILIVGDSTGVGTGASSAGTSLAGLVGARYPQAEIVNRAVNGAKTLDAIAQLQEADGGYDLVMVHIGGNDIVRFTPYDETTRNIRTVLDIAASKGTHVLLTTSGSIGTARLFPSPTRWLLTRRTKNVREIFLHAVAATKGDARYTDLFRQPALDPFALDPEKYYAEDFFHPSDAGYADWFSLMSMELDAFPLSD